MKNESGAQDSADTGIIPGTPGPGQTKGNIGGGIIKFSDSLSGNDLRNVAQHEFIHIIGLDDEKSGANGHNVSDHSAPKTSD